MGIRDRIAGLGRAVVEELERASGNPTTRSVDRFPSINSRSSHVARKGDVDQHFPDKRNLQEYWDLYQHIPIVRDPIRSFASEVVSPGYYIDAENDDLKDDLEEWLQTSAIVNGEIDRDFRIIIKKSVIQREVKGTSLVEKVENQKGNLYGFKLMKPETIRAFTLPGQTVLLPPDYEEPEPEEGDGMLENLSLEQDVYYKENGEAAAYVQIDDQVVGQSEGYYIPFARDDILKLTRDSDVGEIFGKSRLAAVEDRLHALLKKLEDNDKAIESLAHPMQLFKFGDEENPWEPKEIEAFMSQHSQDQFQPGMKQGVQGDVDIDTVSGEVAPIEDYLDYDLNWILSEMPMPRYSLGGFTSDTNQFVSRSLSARLERQLEDARQEIQKEWHSVLREKVKELDYDVEEFNGLVIGEDPSQINLVEEEKRKEEKPVPEDSDSLPENSAGEATNPDGNNSDTDNIGASGEDESRPPASTEPDRSGNGGME